MNWQARDLKESPVVFDCRDDDGVVVNSIHWDHAALDFGAYVDSTGTVKERDFGRAQESAARAAQNIETSRAACQQILFGERPQEMPATSKRPKRST